MVNNIKLTYKNVILEVPIESLSNTKLHLFTKSVPESSKKQKFIKVVEKDIPRSKSLIKKLNVNNEVYEGIESILKIPIQDIFKRFEEEQIKKNKEYLEAKNKKMLSHYVKKSDILPSYLQRNKGFEGLSYFLKAFIKDQKSWLESEPEYAFLKKRQQRKLYKIKKFKKNVQFIGDIVQYSPEQLFKLAKEVNGVGKKTMLFLNDMLKDQYGVQLNMIFNNEVDTIWEEFKDNYKEK